MGYREKKYENFKKIQGHLGFLLKMSKNLGFFSPFFFNSNERVSSLGSKYGFCFL